jgi:hypothetical protein
MLVFLGLSGWLAVVAFGPAVSTASVATTQSGGYSYDSLVASTTSPANSRVGAFRDYDAFAHLSRERVRAPVGLLAIKAGRPAVSDTRLGRAVADDYRGGPNPVGDGSALDAARHTVRTGDLVGGSTHLEKVVEMRDRYSRILRRGGLDPAEEAVARGRFDAYRGFSREHRLDEMMRARGLR